MSDRWFRVYASLIDDPKWIKLGPDLKVALITMWCVAAGNDGRLPPVDDMAIKFRLSEQRTEKLLEELRRCGFVDDDETGATPHNWNGRQFKSDVSTERVQQFRKRFRERPRNVSRDVSETSPETETETEAEKKVRANARTARARTLLPENFSAHFRVAEELRWEVPRILQEFERFKTSAIAHNRKYADWQAAWDNWCRSPFQQQNQQGNGHGQLHGKRAGSILDAIDRLEFGESGTDQAAIENPVQRLPSR